MQQDKPEAASESAKGDPQPLEKGSEAEKPREPVTVSKGGSSVTTQAVYGVRSTMASSYGGAEAQHRASVASAYNQQQQQAQVQQQYQQQQMQLQHQHQQQQQYLSTPQTVTSSYYNQISGNQSPSMMGNRFAMGNAQSYGGASVSSQSYAQGVTTSQTYAMRDQRILSERIIEHEVRVPKKVVREDVIEKVVIIPEKIIHEEVIEEIAKVREKIIEIATPVIQERIVEVPEIEYVEKIVEVPEIIYQEKIREVPRIEIQERIIEVPRIVVQEKIIEIPEIEYREIPYEKIVEVPEIVEQIVVKEIPVPQYVDKPVPEYVTVEVEQEVHRSIPVPVEAIATCEFVLPRLRPRYSAVDVPLYVPRFVEVPVPVDTLDASTIAQAEQYAQHVTMLTSQGAVSLCEVENLAGSIKNADFASLMSRKDYIGNLTQHWQAGRLHIEPATLQYVNTSSYTSTVTTGATLPVTERVVGTYTSVSGAQVLSPGAPLIVPLIGSSVTSQTTTKVVEEPAAEDVPADSETPAVEAEVTATKETAILNAGVSTAGIVLNGGVVELSGSEELIAGNADTLQATETEAANNTDGSEATAEEGDQDEATSASAE